MAIGQDGTITDVNAATEAATGCLREDLIGTEFSTYFAEPEKARSGYQQVFREGFVLDYPLEIRHQDGHGTPVLYNASLYRDEAGRVVGGFAAARDITERKKAEASLKNIEWLLTKRLPLETYAQPYGNVVALNRSGEILEAVGEPALRGIVGSYLDLLGTSAAVYEKNGEYACGIFSSGWCRLMDHASRKLCGTEDNQVALHSGKWLCHESCWNDASKVSIETAQATDIPCKGGIRLYAIPIKAGEEIIGSLNFGFGEPPRDPQQLRDLADAYGVDAEQLGALSRSYETIPPYIVELAKRQAATAAQLIGDMVLRKRAEREIGQLNAELEQRGAARTAQLEAANKELEAFAYSVSHDLRAPLRSIDGFSQAVLEDYAGKVDEPGRDYLRRVRAASQPMAELIDNLLTLSRVTRSEMHEESVDLSGLAREIAEELRRTNPERQVTFVIAKDLAVRGDKALLRGVLDNLLGNAWKFTAPHAKARIEFGTVLHEGRRAYFVRDDGVGFDMAYAGKLFVPFQRLHTTAEFPGHGIGLATVQRIIRRHGGRVWAEGAVEGGATFYFTFG